VDLLVGRKIVAGDSLSTSQADSTELGQGCVCARDQKEVSGAALYLMEILFRHLDFAGHGILSILTGRAKMPDEPLSPTLDRKLTTDIVAAYVRRNQIGADQLPVLISTVHQTLSTLGKPVTELDGERTPAVPIRRSVNRNYVVCLECGWRGQMLRRHLNTGHGLSVDQYRARWNLSREHPLTAPGYSERRSSLAKQIGLGRELGASREEPQPVAREGAAAAQPRRRRRP
jgi:predicted transcriptional regulator